MALYLAESFGFDTETQLKAQLAGLVHDCAKLMSPEQLFAACNEFDIALTEEDRHAPQTLHAYVGAKLVEQELDVTDAEVLSAITYHTTGRPNMGVIETLVYIADKIESKTRKPELTQATLARLDFGDRRTLDDALLYLMDSTIEFLLRKGQLIHPRTLAARNELIVRNKQAKHPSMLC